MIKIGYQESLAMSKVNLWDRVIFRTGQGRSTMDGTVVGITMRGVHVNTSFTHLFVKWCNVVEIEKRRI